MNEQEVKNDIAELRKSWSHRATKFTEWYDMLCLVDKLKTKGMESSVSNDPRTFFNMAHFLFTAGETQHRIPIMGESQVELEKQARVERACQYMWREIDAKRQKGGSPAFVSELGFYLLLLGWYSLVVAIDENNQLIPQLWSPADVFPRYEDNQLTACVHEYQTTVQAARRKALAKGWNYSPRATSGNVRIDDYFYLDENGILQNMILIDDKDVTGIVSREDLMLLVAPVGGFPDRGSLGKGTTWQQFIGQGILETDRTAVETLNKWMSIIMQHLRDSVQLKYQEFSASPQATGDQLRDYGSLFHYAPGEQGLQPVPIAPMPMETRALQIDLEKRIQKGAFSDAVYGMVEGGMAGYALSQLAGSSANQIMHPYMQTKDFIIAESDKFWLRRVKTSKKVFIIKGKKEEKMHPIDIPEDADIVVSSEMATQKDWLERATIANMVKEHVDSETILTEVLKLTDTAAIGRRKSLDDFNQHPVTKQLKLIISYRTHANFLRAAGDSEQADLFQRAADALEMQMGAPEPGAARPPAHIEAEAAREAGAPPKRARVRPEVMPPEERGGFTPEELRGMIGRGRAS